MIQKKLVAIENISVDELVEVIVEKVLNGLEERKNKLDSLTAKEELLTREEITQYLKISKTSLWKYTKSGRLKAYGLGNRVYYKKKEVDEALMRIN